MIKKLFFMISGSLLILSAYFSNNEKGKDTNDQEGESHMKHTGESKVSEDTKSTNKGELKMGDKVMVAAEHIPGMKGAEATVKDTYKIYAYVVSYEPTNGSEKVSNHRWVVDEEIKDAPKDGLSKGDTIKLEANRVSGMKSATTNIDNTKKTTVYVVNYKSKDNGKIIKDHKWMTGNEPKTR